MSAVDDSPTASACDDAAGAESAAPLATLARLKQEVEAIERLDLDLLRKLWKTRMGRPAPAHLGRALLIRILSYQRQIDELGDVGGINCDARRPASVGTRKAAAGATGTKLRGERQLRTGTMLMREHNGVMNRVRVSADGFEWNDKTFRSLSEVAFAITGTKWNGPRFFGLRPAKKAGETSADGACEGISARRRTEAMQDVTQTERRS